MKNLKTKVLAVVLSIALVGTLFAAPFNTSAAEESETEKAYITYDFENEDQGSACGKVTLTTEDADIYFVYFGDDNGDKLTRDGMPYSALFSCDTTNSALTAEYSIDSPYAAIPEGASKLMAYNSAGEEVAVYDIPSSKQFDAGDVSYRFGLMSDVHFNRYSDYYEDDAVPAFDNALKFMDDIGVDFVGLTGDLSSNSEDSAFTKFKSAIDKYPDMTVYTCMGNHDDYNIKGFVKYVNTKKDTDTNVTDINDNGADFVYHKGGDVFIFFSQTKWSYNATLSYLVTDDQLNWLEKTLNKYADQNVYLFFHTYFASEDGDVTTAVGNLINPGGYTYDLTYTFGNADEARFRSLLNKYPNVTMFSGHSHWAYDQQKYNPNLNIGNIKSDKSGASLVHVSSVTAPRTVEENASSREENNGVRSEGMLATKYGTSTVYTGIDFMNGQYLSYAVYVNEDGAKGTPEPAVTVGKTKITSIGKLRKVSKKSKKYKVKIRYKKVKGAYKYQIQYTSAKKFKSQKTKSKNSKKVTYTLNKLKNNTRYKVRVRAYKVQFGYNVYGKWSKAKKIKIKNGKKVKKKKK